MTTCPDVVVSFGPSWPLPVTITTAVNGAWEWMERKMRKHIVKVFEDPSLPASSPDAVTETTVVLVGQVVLQPYLNICKRDVPRWKSFARHRRARIVPMDANALDGVVKAIMRAVRDVWVNVKMLLETQTDAEKAADAAPFIATLWSLPITTPTQLWMSMFGTEARVAHASEHELLIATVLHQIHHVAFAALNPAMVAEVAVARLRSVAAVHRRVFHPRSLLPLSDAAARVVDLEEVETLADVLHLSADDVVSYSAAGKAVLGATTDTEASRLLDLLHLHLLQPVASEKYQEPMTVVAAATVKRLCAAIHDAMDAFVHQGGISVRDADPYIVYVALNRVCAFHFTNADVWLHTWFHWFAHAVSNVITGGDIVEDGEWGTLALACVDRDKQLLNLRPLLAAVGSRRETVVPPTTITTPYDTLLQGPPIPPQADNWWLFEWLADGVERAPLPAAAQHVFEVFVGGGGQEDLLPTWEILVLDELARNSADVDGLVLACTWVMFYVLSSSSSSTDTTTGASSCCCVCLNATDNTSQCGDHPVCLDCSRRTIASRVLRGQTTEGNLLACVDPGCTNTLSPCMPEFVDALIRYQRLMCAHGVALAPCATCWGVLSPYEFLAPCDVCGQQTCGQCGNMAHPGVLCAGTTAATTATWLDRLAAQACPGCGIRTFKTSGCNHMLCSGCAMHWCWDCGDPLGTSDMVMHYTTCPLTSTRETDLRRARRLLKVWGASPACVAAVLECM